MTTILLYIILVMNYLGIGLVCALNLTEEKKDVFERLSNIFLWPKLIVTYINGEIE